MKYKIQFNLIKKEIFILISSIIMMFVSNSCKSELETSTINNQKNIDSNNLTLEASNLKNSKKVNFSNLDFEILRDTIKKYGITEMFFEKLIANEKSKFEPKYIKMNVTNLFKSGGKSDYSTHYNKNAVEKTTKFIKENNEVLTLAQNKYGVPKEFIAAILWVETRHGNYTGDNSVISVFLTTAMSNTPKISDDNLNLITEYYNENNSKTGENDNKDLSFYIDKYKTRANKKANWALGELAALESIYNLNKLDIFELRGSYAGAFGMSQFLPSSYNSWAVDGNGDNKIDLFDKVDAIFSVANYLKTNGWDGTDEGRKKSIFHYNNSNDYVNAVSTLAEKVKS
ncbi:MAG: lytic murein transglycosylase [Candidatus Kapaibacteriota bacterium]|jgi:membrane-bound lytic murein transglycosylase B